jgi:ABC-type multidrug transport system fused ATPase/permease subunit
MARIVIRKTPIVIMDEATSNLDDKTDAIIQSVIRKKLHGVTVINVTKNIANILDYDQILVFDHGEIVERGSSKELILKKGQFHDIMAEN